MKNTIHRYIQLSIRLDLILVLRKKLVYDMECLIRNIKLVDNRGLIVETKPIDIRSTE